MGPLRRIKLNLNCFKPQEGKEVSLPFDTGQQKHGESQLEVNLLRLNLPVCFACFTRAKPEREPKANEALSISVSPPFRRLCLALVRNGYGSFSCWMSLAPPEKREGTFHFYSAFLHSKPHRLDVTLFSSPFVLSRVL